MVCVGDVVNKLEELVAISATDTGFDKLLLVLEEVELDVLSAAVETENLELES